jgi:hypothetical protein
MYARLLQDWVTVRAGSGNALTQGEAAWLDLADFLDVVAFIETKNFSATGATLYPAFQTSPTKDESLFQTMNDITSTTGTPLALGVQTFIFLRDTALCPLARWLRWQLIATGASVFEATFRIWIAANAPGGFGDSMGAQSGDGVSDGGGPAYTDAPPASIGGPASPSSKLGDIIHRMNRGVVLGKNSAPITFGQTSSQPPSYWRWNDKLKTPAPKKSNWPQHVNQWKPPVSGVRLPWVSPEVKKS